MASTCPNCGKTLHIWNVKAECSACGVSIPNHNWQERLEEDSEKAEKQFAVFYKSLNRIAYSIWGTKLRIARLVLTFLPAIGFILPWANLNSDGESFSLTIISIFNKNKSLIDFFKSFFGNASLYMTNMKFEGYSGPLTFAVIGYLFFVLSALFIVLAFLMTIILCKKPKTKAMVGLDIVSIAFSVVSVVMFVMSGPLASQAGAFNFGDMPVFAGSASISWGYFVALVLLLVATGINIAVAKAPAKSDETLEKERLSRKAIKDEKERQKEIERIAKPLKKLLKRKKEKESKKLRQNLQPKLKKEKRNNLNFSRAEQKLHSVFS